MHFRVPVAVFLALTLAACGGGETPEAQPPQEIGPPPADVLADAPAPFQLTAEQASGKVVYETMCWSCHGFAGRGDGPAVQSGAVPAPRDFKTGVLSGASVRQIQADFQAEVGGLDPSHPHMANVLSIVDISAFSLALGYLQALTYPPEFTVGSAIAGHRNYLLRCQGCHGPGGRGDGPGAEVLNPTPANFTQDTLLAARNFQAAFDKIRFGGGGVHGSAMPAWGVMLDDGDVWDLVAYISTFQPGVLSVPPTQGR
ncbi:MAG: c-type cytochrome [Longimicrobiales bacterium]|nr:c-type cytochrome [Longimicrobiales bacterium]